MDVHHHPHGGKRSWKSYAGEFLMLFFAVFCGFIAENLREHYVEKERAHQYLGSMRNDLKKDTGNLERAIDLNKLRVSGIDTILAILSGPLSDSAIKKIYGLNKFITSSETYENATTTISQLKNAGGYRLLTDTGVVNHIVRYDQQNELLKEQGNVYTSFTVKILDMLTEMMDFSAGKKNGKPFYFDTKDASKQRVFFNRCYIQQRLITSYITMLEDQKAEAVNIIALIDKKI